MFIADKPLQFQAALLMPGNVRPVETGLLSMTGHCRLSYFFFFIFPTLQRAHKKHEGGTGAICTTALLTHFHLKKWSRI